jgi:DNA-binding NarL/FixJ family response regulator
MFLQLLLPLKSRWRFSDDLPPGLSFQELQKKWYSLLGEKGFQDAETNNKFLKRWDSLYFHVRHTPQEFALKKDYFRKAGFFLNEFHFQSNQEKQIWALHAEGLSYREIADQLRNKFKKINKDKVNKIVTQLKNIMKEIYIDD